MIWSKNLLQKEMVMTSQKRIARVKAVAIAAVALCAFSACHTDVGVGVKSDGSIKSVVTLNDSEGKLKAIGLGSSCEELASGVKTQIGITGGTFDVKDKSKEGKLSCEFTAESGKNMVDGKTLTETDKTFILSTQKASTAVPKEQLSMLKNFGKFTLTISMPGDIVKAEGAKIDGNLAMFSDLEKLATGFSVEGYKVGSGSIDDAKLGAAHSGIPTWVWIVSGTAIIALIVVLIVMFTRKKKTATPAESESPATTPLPEEVMPEAPAGNMAKAEETPTADAPVAEETPTADAPTMEETPAVEGMPAEAEPQPSMEDIMEDGLNKPGVQAGNIDDEPQMK